MTSVERPNAGRPNLEILVNILRRVADALGKSEWIFRTDNEAQGKVVEVSVNTPTLKGSLRRISPAREPRT